MRTLSPPAVSETSLAALLKVARSLPSPLLVGAAPPRLGVGAGAAVLTPSSDRSPSRLLLMSIVLAPYRVYRHCPRITLVICRFSSQYCGAKDWLPQRSTFRSFCARKRAQAGG